MTRESLERELPAGNRLLLDSSGLISYLRGGEATTSVAKHIIEEFVQFGRNEALVSAVTAMEILVRPLRVGGPGGQHVLSFLSYWPNLRVVSADLAIAQQAANLRALYGYKPADALVIGTGLVYQVGTLVTNDDRWRKVDGLVVHVCCLSDHLPFT